MHLLNHSPSPHAIGRAIPLGLVLIALAVTAAACDSSPSASVANLGSSKATTTTTPGSAASGSGGSSLNSGGAASSAGQPSSSATLGGVTVEFAQCMRSHGISDFPDPNSQGQATINDANPQSSSFEAAQRACAKYSKGGGKLPSAARQQQAIAQALRYSECMRSHGISDFPDPEVSPSSGGVSIGIRIKAGQGSDLNPNDPRFQAAQKACQSLMLGGR